MIKDVLRISKELIYDQPFYGSVLLSLHKEISKQVPTAGVGIQGIMYKLKINPDFWNTLSDKHKQGLLIHELGHIINFHLTDYYHLSNKVVANIAMDLYINQTIPVDMLPEGGCTCEAFNLPTGESTNWYYKELIKEQEKKKPKDCLSNAMKACSGNESEFDDGKGNKLQVPNHEWEEIEEASDAIKKMLGKNTEQILNDIVKQLSNQPGTVPGDVVTLLEKLSVVEPPKFNWRAYMRTFTGTSTKTWVRKTRRKKSKRFKDAQGSREEYYSNILVAIDTSASVCDDDLIEFQGELKHMHRTGHDIQIVMCDTEINNQFTYNPRKPLEVKGRGGTDFQPVIDLFKKNLRKYSCLIYLTDGEASVPDDPKGQILWVHGTDHTVNDSLPGRCIKLN